ncbi:type II CAAX endopeptidase family protein [Proteinivorax hydrogeniformans]|uniref:Type II CAAX endopeptidase family protein n=1 Tax=Proteinivorax hydrogeniformans TaxID=1826727 RepID=A0AAU8HUU1_9FIRM
MFKRAIIFISFTFVLTWGFWWLLALLTHHDITSFESALSILLLFMGGIGPTIGAYVAILATDKKDLKEFHSKVLKIEVNYKYFLFAFLVPVLLGVLGISMAFIIDREFFINNPIGPLYFFIPSIASAIIFGGIEELGWRGVLQPELFKVCKNIFLINLIIGVVWALWHLPLFYIQGSNHFGNSFLAYTLTAIGFSSFLTWLYDKTKSVLLCVLFHASINATMAVGLSVPMNETLPNIAQGALILFLGTVLLLKRRVHYINFNKKMTLK